MKSVKLNMSADAKERRRLAIKQIDAQIISGVKPYKVGKKYPPKTEFIYKLDDEGNRHKAKDGHEVITHVKLSEKDIARLHNELQILEHRI